MQSFYSGFAVPFNLFGITPLSRGFNMRNKNDDNSGLRTEFLGDYISSEQQIRALALLLGAYGYAFDNVDGKVPIHPKIKNKTAFGVSQITDNILENGRYSPIDMQIFKDSTTIQMFADTQAQRYIELFYQWISPAVKLLGTNQEVSNLESFIFGNQPLEFDRFKFFANLLDREGKTEGIYTPLPSLDEAMPNKVISAPKQSRRLPLEGRLLGNIAANHESLQVMHMGWGDLIIGGRSGGRILGMDQIYEFAASKLLPAQSEKLAPSPKTRDVTPPCASMISKPEEHVQIGPLEYDRRKDLYIGYEEQTLLRKIGKTIVYGIKNNTESWITSLLSGLAIGGGVALLSALFALQPQAKRNTIDHYINTYQTNNMPIVCQTTNKIEAAETEVKLQ
jgi:hypothetical protein